MTTPDNRKMGKVSMIQTHSHAYVYAGGRSRNFERGEGGNFLQKGPTTYYNMYWEKIQSTPKGEGEGGIRLFLIQISPSGWLDPPFSRKLLLDPSLLKFLDLPLVWEDG